MQRLLKLMHALYPADIYEGYIEVLKPLGVRLTWRAPCYAKDPDTKRICEHGVWAMMNYLHSKQIDCVEIRYVSSLRCRRSHNNRAKKKRVDTLFVLGEEVASSYASL